MTLNNSDLINNLNFLSFEVFKIIIIHLFDKKNFFTFKTYNKYFNKLEDFSVHFLSLQNKFNIFVPLLCVH